VDPLDERQRELEALEQGRAFADLSAFRKVRVAGADARAWLHDLITCDVATIEPGMSRRSLVLSPTGRIRADFAVAQHNDGFILLQAPDQPEHVGLVLGRYVLSSDVALHDSTNELSLLGVPGRAAELVGRPVLTSVLTPSVLGAGVDLLTPEGSASWRAEEALVKHDLVEASADSLEVWRIRRGVPRMGADFGKDALPAEAGLEDAIDLTKGCFLGQEAVAKVRNLGHPPRVLRRVRVSAPVEAGTLVMAGTEVAGTLTSAAEGVDDGGGRGATAGIVRVRWEFAGAELTTENGAPMVAVGSMD
jgi:folate-binding protein YgfZ